MGFDDRLLNKKLLDKYNYDIDKVIDDLVMTNDEPVMTPTETNIFDG
jgi:hypothetical protein